MDNNYLSVERNGKVVEHIAIKDIDNEALIFDNVLNMSYDEIKNYDELGSFVTCIMDATNDYFDESDDQTIVNLVDENGIFIWGIIIGPGEDEGYIRYVLVDWNKDGKSYRYEK